MHTAIGFIWSKRVQLILFWVEPIIYLVWFPFFKVESNPWVGRTIRRRKHWCRKTAEINFAFCSRSKKGEVLRGWNKSSETFWGNSEHILGVNFSGAILKTFSGRCSRASGQGGGKVREMEVWGSSCYWQPSHSPSSTKHCWSELNVCCYHLLATILARCQHLCAMQRLAASCMALYAACMEGGASDNSWWVLIRRESGGQRPHPRRD